MRIKALFLGFGIAIAAMSATSAAYAIQFNIGPGGVYVDPGYGYDNDNRRYDNWGISADEAVRIARHNGVRRVEDVQRHRDSYEVSGQDRHHDDITVTIDRRNGRILDIERD